MTVSYLFQHINISTFCTISTIKKAIDTLKNDDIKKLKYLEIVVSDDDKGIKTQIVKNIAEQYGNNLKHISLYYCDRSCKQFRDDGIFNVVDETFFDFFVEPTKNFSSVFVC